MAESIESLAQLAREINTALVRVGRADWRREFNVRFWSCNRDRALALAAEYRAKLMRVIVSQGLDQTSDRLLTAARR
jgi:hypothetical protein